MGWVSLFDPERQATPTKQYQPMAILYLGPVPKFSDQHAVVVGDWRSRNRCQNSYLRTDGVNRDRSSPSLTIRGPLIGDQPVKSVPGGQGHQLSQGYCTVTHR